MKIWFLPFLLLLLNGCGSSPRTQFGTIELGTEKGQVLNILGSPDHRYRKNDTDRWVYRFSDDKDSKKFVEKEIWFQNGRVVFRDQSLLPIKSKMEPDPQDYEPVN